MAVVIAILMLTALLLFLTLTTGIQHYQFASNLDQRARARDLAESAIYLTLAELCRNPNFQGTITVPAAGLTPDGEGHLSFDTATAHGWHIPASSNNLQGLTSLPGDGRSVPRTAAYLVAYGRSGGQKLQIETVFARPPFPTGLAAQGPVLLESVRLWGEPPDQVPAQPPTPDPWEPANVFTNRTGATALTLDPACTIFGNALAGGEIVLRPGAVVRGEVHAHSAQRTIPHLDIPAMWTNLSQFQGIIPFLPGETLETFCVLNNSLSVSTDLKLNGGVLAVNGNLDVSGKISGRGFVLATGNVTAGAGVDLVPDDRLALLAGNDLRLLGAGRSYYLSGLIYAKGVVDCQDLTVHGALIQDDESHAKTVTLRRVNVLQDRIGVIGGAGLPFVFQIQNNHPFSRGERFELHLQAYPDPRNNTRLLFSGQAGTGDNETQNASLTWYPWGPDRAWTITFAPPVATWHDASADHSGFVQGRVAGAVTTVAYDGSEQQLLALLEQILEKQKAGNWARTVGNPASANPQGKTNAQRIKDYINAIKTGQSGLLNMDLNNLLPPIETCRFLTWKEGALTR